jgi:chemotaxis protein MotB
MSDGAPVDLGAPKWTATFADLMSLLLAFFVLLFSFSELDRQKYKQVAGSMKDAFGVQREVKADDPPRGINVIATEFSAGTPTPTPMNSVRQFTTDDLQRLLRMPSVSAVIRDRMMRDMEQLKASLEKEIEDGLIDVELDDTRIVVRIRERGAFPSGSADLEPGFEPIMKRIAGSLRSTGGDIVIAGHTDDVPIANARFRSNWELSAARAVTVLHELVRLGGLEQDDLELQGFADTRPVADNATAEGRALNRRVEVTVVYASDQKPSELPSFEGGPGGGSPEAPQEPPPEVLVPFS